MFRITTLNRALNLFGIGKDGFKDGDLATAVKPTELNAEWANNVQEEPLSVIEGYGLVPSPLVRNQLFQAIKRATGGNVTTVNAANSPFVLTADHAGMVIMDAAGGGVVANLPLANAVAFPVKFLFIGKDTTTNTRTVNATGGDNIDGASLFFVGASADYRAIQSNTATIWSTTSQKAAAAVLKGGLINGGCQIAQQAAVGIGTTPTYGAVDMFASWATGTAVTAGSNAQDTASPIGRSGFAHKLAGVTITGAGVVFTRQRVESLKAKRFKNQAASFSVLVHHDVGAPVNYQVTVRKPTAADNWTASAVIATGPLTAVPTATGTLLTFPNIAMGDCSNGIEVEVQAQCGAVVTKNFSFTEWQLEEGPAVTPFGRIDVDLELLSCKRYFNAGVKSYSTITGVASASFGSPQSFSEMRVTPTALNTAFYYNPTACSNPTVVPQSTNAMVAYCTFSVNGSPSFGIQTDLSARL